MAANPPPPPCSAQPSSSNTGSPATGLAPPIEPAAASASSSLSHPVPLESLQARHASYPASSPHPDHGELFLQEIEAVDDYWGPTFRAIYESDASQAFLERLEQRTHEHDAEIEKMCNHHYQGFISSVRDLLGVRSDAETLKAEVGAIDNDIRNSGQGVAVKARDLVKARRVERNIAATIESLSLCLPVLQMFTKLNKQMSEKRFHPALKTLEQLEHTYLPRIAKYRFSKQMQASIPRLREGIKEASISELKDFLEKIREYSPRIGELAMRKTALKMNLDHTLAKDHGAQSGIPSNPFGGDIDDDEDDQLNGTRLSLSPDKSPQAAQDFVDFGPVYRGLHIYTKLGERDKFQSYYQKQRLQQAKLTQQPPPNMHESIEGYSAFFYGIIGFFACEDHVLNTGNGLITRGYLDELWKGMSTGIKETLQQHSAYCTESGFILKIKNLMLLFSRTLQSYGFDDDQMSSLLQELRDHYTEVLMLKWVAKFSAIFKVDNYHPIEVNNPDEYSSVTNNFPLTSPSLEEAPFPRQFPFSAMVPKVYNEVKEFILSCVQFSQDLHLSFEEIDQAVRKATNTLLTPTLSGCLSNLIRTSNLSLLQLIQIDINTYHLEETNVHLEKYISDITGANLENSSKSRLQARAIFKDIRVEAEEEIHCKLISKMDEFIELASYDWLMSEPEGTSSSWLTDLIAFLNSVFLSFTNLPVKLAQKTCMSALQYLAKCIQAMLLDESVKALSHGFIQQLDLDVVQCEQFAASEPVTGLEEGVLLLCFSDLRQLLDLFVSWDWSNYLADYGNPTSKYIRVKPQHALILLDKLKEAEKKNMFGIMNKKDRDKKRLVDIVYKQLKNLTLQQTNGV
ncbi:exocyst complex component 6B-like [Tigriopus californicus]|uniref:exocyst complex component 6B-like n=1 Tax=Tigriopus californicus TaxID=6832 RepID=UPI0027DA810D|nr:exocyst complex component 6B-like [Tigriopus californicus]